ncbi:CPCC family cysteine-rich protein [Sorangium sp. So ce726]|uniref:CPCC family cysteine-rich protein n=1 Tax=Sorangium sp. So ce726 TaxID=3133319 RepID=UPI003F63429C
MVDARRVVLEPMDVLLIVVLAREVAPLAMLYPALHAGPTYPVEAMCYGPAMSTPTASHPCPCCGYLVFNTPPGSHEICDFCFWQDDRLQLEFATTLSGGANPSSLLAAQRNNEKHGASEPILVWAIKEPAPDQPRDPQWRPIDLERDIFESWDDPNRACAPIDADLYYWRPTYWRGR